MIREENRKKGGERWKNERKGRTLNFLFLLAFTVPPTDF